MPRDARRRGAVRFIAGVALSTSVLWSIAGCSSDDSSDSSQPPSTVQADAEDFLPDPRLPADINPIPFLVGDEVALGNASIRVVEVRDPDGEPEGEGSRRVAIDVELTNGALEPVTFDPDTIRAYVDTGESATPTDASDFDDPVASRDALATTLQFDVPAEAALLALVFDGTSYGDRVSSGLIALDPNFVPAPGDA